MSKAWGAFGTARRDRPGSRRRERFHVTPRIDLLEGRALLSTLAVINAGDNVAGSLRQTIANAQPGDTIVFSRRLTGSTINLAGSELVIERAWT
jgi:hypothetical protein